MKKFTLLTLFLTIFLLSSPVLAKTTNPPEPKPEQVFSLSGFQVQPGWNYFSLGDTSCPLETIFNELQADAGGGIYIDTLFAKPSKGTWAQYDYGKVDLLTVIPTGTIIAYESLRRFYVDMASKACSEEPKAKRTTQIAQARAVAKTNDAVITANEEEKMKKLQELQRIPSFLDPIKNWFTGLWQKIAKFFESLKSKK